MISSIRLPFTGIAYEEGENEILLFPNVIRIINYGKSGSVREE